MTNETGQFTPRGFIKTLTILHLALIAGPIAFACFAYFQIQDVVIDFTNTDDSFLLIIPIFAIGAISMGNLVYKKLTAEISKIAGLKQKLMRFQTASLIKFASIEAPALFSVVVFYMTGNMAFLLIAVVLIFYFFTLRPTKVKIENSLALRGEEKSQFNKLDHPIS
ncbi:hypothetical protein LV716_03275 [Flagellimonas sp. HMM57]|uniref:hypothetical protein n=1 Tax=unclassified Flagellimonas TaxID=2644544 RepID=UPI0013D1EABC|nr:MULTISPECIES: hypothetical protein [unclassified Flagellimonas]UII76825.1 hypothetical protein LV716_03275 [Flagellimonas sp. HMM57]